MSLDAALLHAWERRPFVYGETDCARFALAFAQHYGNLDVTLPDVASERDYLRLISQHGSLGSLVRERMDAPVPVREAQIGDVVLSAFPEMGEVLGVADPPVFWIRTEDGKFLPVSLDLAIGVWPCRR